jgi:hypothetical protein
MEDRAEHPANATAATAATGRFAYACLLAVVTPLGLATKFYAGPGAAWVADYAGGFLYVLFWVFLVLTLAPEAPPGTVALWVLGITSGLELLQLWHPPVLQRVRTSFLGHALIGSTFSWWDFAYYGLAAAAAPALARRVQARASRSRSR